ncbi:MAG: hypothetical protein IT250_12020 [Chitinophagaceae bacterium]|nr:hypothetical protein [Chitinophagaceae bacterium]
MAHHLLLNMKAITNKEGEIDETPARLMTHKELAVFDTDHPMPANAVMGNDAVLTLLDR